MRRFPRVAVLRGGSSAARSSGRGSADAGPSNSGTTDSGPTDSGPTDSGPTDSGPTDSGASGTDADSPASLTPPSSGPIATYAAILDGDSLWLAVTGTTGYLALRERETGRVIPLGSDLPSDTPGIVSVRSNVAAATPPGAPATGFDVVAVEGRTAAPVWIEPLPARTAIKPPPSSDGHWQFDLRRGEDGHLRLRRDPRPVVSEVLGAGAFDAEVEFVLSDPRPHRPAPRLVLVDAEDREREVTGTGTERRDGHVVARLGPTDVPAEPGVVTLLALEYRDGEDREVVPVQRRSNDLVAPGRAVVLPSLVTADGEGELVRVQYQHQARVRIWRPEPQSAADSDSAGEG